MTIPQEPQPSQPGQLEKDVARIEASLGPLPPPRHPPPLVVIVGLPGSGKSYFSLRLLESTPLVWLESDALRQTLFGRPTYSPEESQRLFAAIHRVIERLLAARRSVILDATNLRERNRRQLYAIAERHGARLFLVRLWAPGPVIHQRLAQRQRQTGRQDHSEAGYEVYQRMRRRIDPIRQPHIRVNTAQDINDTIRLLVREIEAL